jgi:hypothetical protein
MLYTVAELPLIRHASAEGHFLSHCLAHTLVAALEDVGLSFQIHIKTVSNQTMAIINKA